MLTGTRQHAHITLVLNRLCFFKNAVLVFKNAAFFKGSQIHRVTQDFRLPLTNSIIIALLTAHPYFTLPGIWAVLQPNPKLLYSKANCMKLSGAKTCLVGCSSICAETITKINMVKIPWIGQKEGLIASWSLCVKHRN